MIVLNWQNLRISQVFKNENTFFLQVESGHFPALQTLDDHSSNGALRSALGHGVLGWRVTNSRLQERSAATKRRRRRQVGTPTPVITIAPPTGTQPAGEKTDVDTMTRKVSDKLLFIKSVMQKSGLPMLEWDCR
jgi:hypothetical protein